mgnify:CR=1 FL=1
MTAKSGQHIEVHYRGTFPDGTEFDNSRTRGAPLQFLLGSPEMISGFNDAIIGMSVGEQKTFTLEPEQAYGFTNEQAIQVIPRSKFEPGFVFEVDALIRGQTPDGPFVAKIIEVQDDVVTLDFNHPLAGKTITFEVELLSIEGEQIQLANWTPKMKKAELLEIAKSQGLNVNTRSTKAQIIEALSA